MGETLDRIEIESETALWDWLEANHSSTHSYLLVTWKKADKARYVSRDQVLDALLAYGWVDGRRFALDADRTMQLICQRQQQKWTQTYRSRIETLESDGRLKPSGLQAVTAAKANGTWLANQDVDNLEVPVDLRDQLKTQNGLDWWDNAAPSYRRNILRWLSAAKTAKTRQKRCEIIASSCRDGEKLRNF